MCNNCKICVSIEIVFCIDAYDVLEQANDMKLHVFAIKHKACTYYEYLLHYDVCFYI